MSTKHPLSYYAFFFFNAESSFLWRDQRDRADAGEARQQIDRFDASPRAKHTHIDLN